MVNPDGSTRYVLNVTADFIEADAKTLDATATLVWSRLGIGVAIVDAFAGDFESKCNNGEHANIISCAKDKALDSIEFEWETPIPLEPTGLPEAP